MKHHVNIAKYGGISLNSLGVINAIERVIDKRSVRGASDEDIVKYLLHLRNTWKNDKVILNFINDVLVIYEYKEVAQ